MEVYYRLIANFQEKKAENVALNVCKLCSKFVSCKV